MEGVNATKETKYLHLLIKFCEVINSKNNCWTCQTSTC